MALSPNDTDLTIRIWVESKIKITILSRHVLGATNYQADLDEKKHNHNLQMS